MKAALPTAVLVVAVAGLGSCASKESPPSLSAGSETEFVLHTRRRAEVGGAVQPLEETRRWEAKKTAVIICDMWDDHNCKSAARRVAEMVPRLNEFLRAARARGALVIHAPSDVIKFYEGTPGRALALSAPKANPPVEIKRCPYDPKREGPFPFDNEAWGCDDDPQCPIQKTYPWTREHPGIEIQEGDAISADGREIYNLCEARGITNILMTGVHTNYCIVGRSFGIRQMVALGRSIVLVRDLTDALYNPKIAPFVSHTKGTELVIEHIERYWCPSILSRDVIGR
jgi:nicotinamidase-related amidase